MNIVETILNIIYVYLTHSIQWPGAPLLGFGAALMTLSKTLLYWLNEYHYGFCQIGHNNTSTLIIYWIHQWVSSLLLLGLGIYYHQPFISRLWIVVPSMIVWVLGKSIIRYLVVASDSPKVHSKKMI